MLAAVLAWPQVFAHRIKLANPVKCGLDGGSWPSDAQEAGHPRLHER